jgi:hypothetical protein
VLDVFTSSNGAVVRAESTVGGSTGVEGIGATGVRGTGGPFGVVGFGTTWAVLAQGHFSATGMKAFVHPNPVDPETVIRFVSLEGNESGTYFRGTSVLVDGVARIPVPEEFRMVTDPSGLTVQVTARGPVLLWTERPNLFEIVVRGETDVEFDYFVNGVRRGFTNLSPTIANDFFRPTERGVPYGMQYPPAYRQLLVENGILNSDFTPNEVTAARLGWKLRDPQPLPVPPGASVATDE